MSTDPPRADTPRLRPQFRLQYEPAQSAWVLLYPEGMVKLSASAAEIIKRIDGETTVEALVRELEAAFPGAALRQDVVEFIGIAHARGWISIGE
ncbi:MAG TPA: pyrroloquinoline quinone biosynthesis peptide chaperone PqqD [Casimicrobiaceae bacterium]|nr:pyrroloquinoline quinone biosynthesis peptide chaperone PqqD [Casimicrobiaceae bacterium]